MSNESKIDAIADTIKDELKKMGIGPGDEIWTIRKVCTNRCPENDSDHCQLDCNMTDQVYLEKTVIKSINIMIDREQTNLHVKDIGLIIFIDSEEEDFTMKDVGVTIFADKQDAVKKIMERG